MENFYQKQGQACREDPRAQGSAWEGRAGGARQWPWCSSRHNTVCRKAGGSLSGWAHVLWSPSPQGGCSQTLHQDQWLPPLVLRFRALVLRAVISDLFHRANAKPQSPYPEVGSHLGIRYPKELLNTLWNRSSNLFSKICFIYV